MWDVRVLILPSVLLSRHWRCRKLLFCWGGQTSLAASEDRRSLIAYPSLPSSISHLSRVLLSASYFSLLTCVIMSLPASKVSANRTGLWVGGACWRRRARSFREQHCLNCTSQQGLQQRRRVSHEIWKGRTRYWLQRAIAQPVINQIQTNWLERGRKEEERKGLLVCLQYTCKWMLKSFDFFRKIQTDQQLTSATGGVFTLVALVIAGFLILYSIQDFYTEQYYTFLAVENDNSETLPMNIDILFNRMPCNAIAIEFYDELEYIESDIEKKLTLTNLPAGADQGQPYQRILDMDQERAKLQEGIEQGLRCRVRGTIPLPKTPGTLVFKPTAFNNLLLSLDDSLINKARMSYRIDSLTFGKSNGTVDLPISHKSKNVQNYIKMLEGDFNSRQFVQNYHDEKRKLDYFSHLKIIPVVVQGEKNKTTQGYRYSMRSSVAEIDDDPFEGVMFMSEIEPINIIHRRHYPKLYTLVIEILAIVGGTVATIGIANSLSHFLFGIK